MAATWSDRQRALVADSGFMVSAATLFPNLSFVHNWPQIDAAGTVAPFISLRQWQPVSERETEVLSWFAVDAAAPEEFKRNSYKAYLMCFGSSGMFEQDDVENWVSITDMAAGSMARRLNLNSRMGLTSAGKPIKPPLAAFAGPGVAYQGFGEYNQRHWLSQWSDHLARGGPVTAARPLPYGDPAHLAAHQFLVEEAALLDAADYAGWLELLCEDIRYVMPVRVTTARGAGFDSLADMGHFDEDMYALRKRVQRLATDHAWTEDPPSRTRHFVTNVRTFRPDTLRPLAACGSSRPCCCSAAGATRARPTCSRRAARTCSARPRTGCGWPGGRSPWTSRCCAPRTWRCSCNGGRDPAGQRVQRGRGGAGADPQRRPAAHLGAGLGPGDPALPARARGPDLAGPRPVLPAAADPARPRGPSRPFSPGTSRRPLFPPG